MFLQGKLLLLHLQHEGHWVDFGLLSCWGGVNWIFGFVLNILSECREQNKRNVGKIYSKL